MINIFGVQVVEDGEGLVEVVGQLVWVEFLCAVFACFPSVADGVKVLLSFFINKTVLSHIFIINKEEFLLNLRYVARMCHHAHHLRLIYLSHIVLLCLCNDIIRHRQEV
jgi:hypothetical protein